MRKTPASVLKQSLKNKIKILTISLFFIFSSLISINIAFANDAEPKEKQSLQEEKTQKASEEIGRASQKNTKVTEDSEKNNNGFCVCLKCGKKLLNQKGTCCRSINCPECGLPMVRETIRDFGHSQNGFCICPQCGKKLPHQRGVPCRSINCLKCNTPMIRE